LIFDFDFLENIVRVLKAVVSGLVAFGELGESAVVGLTILAVTVCGSIWVVVKFT
jgi:hypothetical protein